MAAGASRALASVGGETTTRARRLDGIYMNQEGKNESCCYQKGPLP
jgi:hypothetical protein